MSVTVAAAQPLAIPNPFSIGADKVIGWIVKGITKAINAFFGGLVKDALNPLLKLLGETLLTTPDPSMLPRVGQLWENSREIAVAVYALIILVAGILVMTYETLQTRQSIKEIGPRVVVGIITANMSLLLAGKAVAFANALSTGLLGQGVDAKSAAATLTSMVTNAVTNGGIFLIFIGIGLALILLALLVTYVIRVALTVILIAGAPLALMCHALPQTEGIARWWWRAFAGVLTIQLAQSLTLVAAMNVFLTNGGLTFFGATGDGLVNVIVTIALLYILYKIPFWILHSVQVGGGRSMVGGIVKGLVAYKTLGLLGARGDRATGAGRQGGPGRSGGPAGGPGGPGGPGPAGSGPRRQPQPGGPSRSGGGQPRRPHPVRLTGAAASRRSTLGAPVGHQEGPRARAGSDVAASRTVVSDELQTTPVRPRSPWQPSVSTPTRVAEPVGPGSRPGRARAPHRPVTVPRRTQTVASPQLTGESWPGAPAPLGTSPPTLIHRPPVSSPPRDSPVRAAAAAAPVRPPLDLPARPRSRPSAVGQIAPRALHPPRGGDDR